MDKTPLVDKEISDGKRLINILDETRFKVKSAFWFYFREPNEWRLVLASNYFTRHGPNKTYGYIQGELEKINPPLAISLINISAIGDKDELIKLLKIALGSMQGINDIRFTRNVINGTMIEDAHIYRLN